MPKFNQSYSSYFFFSFLYSAADNKYLKDLHKQLKNLN